MLINYAVHVRAFDVIGGVLGGLKGGVPGAIIGQAIGGRICRLFVRAESEGCEGVQSEPVAVAPARVGLLRTSEVAALQSGRSIRELIDLRSGKSFNISWDSSPTYHTDWTPATEADTAIVKSIINASGNNVDWTNPRSWPYFVPRPCVLKLNGGS